MLKTSSYIFRFPFSVFHLFQSVAVQIKLTRRNDFDFLRGKTLCQVVFEFRVIADDDNVAALYILRGEIFNLRVRNRLQISHIGIKLRRINAEKVKLADLRRQTVCRFQRAAEISRQCRRARLEFVRADKIAPDAVDFRHQQFGNVGGGNIFGLRSGGKITVYTPPR